MAPTSGDYSTPYLDWKDWHQDTFGTYSTDDAAMFKAELSRAGVNESGQSILELGFGHGSFLAWARASGHRCDGVEVNPELMQFALGQGFDVFPTVDAIPVDRSYQMIVAFDVIEHLADSELPALFRALASRLTIGGSLLVRSPNGDSPLGSYYQNGDLTHRSIIGSHKLRQVAKMVNLDFVYSASPVLPYKSEYTLRGCRVRVLSALRSFIAYVVGRIYYNGNDVCLDPNLVTLLRRSR